MPSSLLNLPSGIALGIANIIHVKAVATLTKRRNPKRIVHLVGGETAILMGEDLAAFESWLAAGDRPQHDETTEVITQIVQILTDADLTCNDGEHEALSQIVDALGPLAPAVEWEPEDDDDEPELTYLTVVLWPAVSPARRHRIEAKIESAIEGIGTITGGVKRHRDRDQERRCGRATCLPDPCPDAHFQVQLLHLDRGVTRTMKRSDLWILTIHFWPRAHALGRRGIPCKSLVEPEQEPQLFYRPHQLHFEHRPTREDFIAVVRRTPWMHGAWAERLLPIVEKHQWPLASWMHKAASVELVVGVQPIGRLDVRRHELHRNPDRHLDPIAGADVKIAVRGMKELSRASAEDLIRDHEYLLMERCLASRHNSRARVQVLRDFLREKCLLGLETRKRKRKHEHHVPESQGARHCYPQGPDGHGSR